ncbi:MAG: transposase [Verrucomicrobiae bacterium]|nr:transposase [Verrucomicrobiae bacterium]
MARLADMIEGRLDGIVAFWERRTTNAYMEALNRVFSAVRRKARGDRTEFYLIHMLYFVASKLPIPMAPTPPSPSPLPTESDEEPTLLCYCRGRRLPRKVSTRGVRRWSQRKSPPRRRSRTG